MTGVERGRRIKTKSDGKIGCRRRREEKEGGEERRRGRGRGHTCPSTGCGPNNPPIALWSEKETHKLFFCFHFSHPLIFHPLYSSMEINVVNRSVDHICDVEVSPTDTIWTLGCKLHRKASIEKTFRVFLLRMIRDWFFFPVAITES
jgi:hypothetical protein